MAGEVVVLVAAVLATVSVLRLAWGVVRLISGRRPIFVQLHLL